MRVCWCVVVLLLVVTGVKVLALVESVGVGRQHMMQPQGCERAVAYYDWQCL